MTRQYRVFAWTILAGLAFAASASAQQAADPYREALGYKFGQPRAALMAIEAQIHAAKPGQLAAIEARLIGILQSRAATTDGKDWACRQLRHVGSDKSLDALAALLADKELATAARTALQSMPGAKADAALRDALPKLQGDLKAGAILTLGARADRGAVALLAPLADAPDAVVAEAALYALGNIGGAEALRAIEQSKPPAALKRYRFHGMLRCAESIAAAGKPADAAAVYHAVYQASDDIVIKTAALRGIVADDKSQAAPVLKAVLRGDNGRLRSSAAKFACEIGGGEVLALVLADLATLPADVQIGILGMVDDKAALPAVLVATKSKAEAVRVAALGALGQLGDASSAAMLLRIAVAEKGESQAAARKGLQELHGKEVDAALIVAAQQEEPGARAEAIRTLAGRGAAGAVPVLLKAAEDAHPAVQAEAIGALGVLAEVDSLPALVKLLAAAKAAQRRSAAEQAVVAVCRRSADKDLAATLVLAALPGASAEVRASLLRVVSRIPSAKAIGALRAAASDADPAAKDAAIRGLADWPDATAIADLLGIARQSGSQVHKVLALRGAIRLIALPSGRPAEQTAGLLGNALALATRAEEKTIVLGVLADVNHGKALELAVGCLADKDLEVEAATAVVKIARKVQTTNPEAATAAVQKIRDVCKMPAAQQVAESAMVVLGDLVNIAPQGVATSPDGLEKDGTSHGDRAAIDGDPATYWDEEDNQKLYRLVVAFKQPEKIAAISISGYEHHQYAPKDFEILGDGKPLKKIENAQYSDNLLIVRLNEVTCKTVELKITGYYGSSPAIRELGIYRPKSGK